MTKLFLYIKSHQIVNLGQHRDTQWPTGKMIHIPSPIYSAVQIISVISNLHEIFYELLN